jgi:hypothetical protein
MRADQGREPAPATPGSAPQTVAAAHAQRGGNGSAAPTKSASGTPSGGGKPPAKGKTGRK